MWSAVSAKGLPQSGLWCPGLSLNCDEILSRRPLVSLPVKVSAGAPTPSIVSAISSDLAETDRRSGSRDPSSSRPRFERVKRRSGERSPIRKVREMGRDEKLDAFGRLRTPRAAREMALCILYAAVLRDVPALQVYEERLSQRIGRDFDREILESYEHTPTEVGNNDSEEDEDKAVELMQQQEVEAELEATVLTAPLPLVYSRFALNFMRNIVKITSEQWDEGEIKILELFPTKWKNDRHLSLLPFCILQMAVAEIDSKETSPKVVINEAIDLTKKFCDGASPRIVNGILGRYMDSQGPSSGVMVSRTSKFTFRAQPTETTSHPENSPRSSRDARQAKS